MSILSKVTTGKVSRPLNILVYGVAGVGKTTLAAKAPQPILMGAEQGADAMDIAKFPLITEWSQVDECLDALLKEDHSYQTLIIDTLDSLETILHDRIKKDSNVASIELAGGGYGKGYVAASEKFLIMRRKLDLLRDKGMNIITLAHSTVVKFHDPLTNVEYDTYRLKLHKRTTPVFVEWVDGLFFADFQTYKKQDGNKKLVFGDGERVIYTEKRPSHEAKNRFNLPSQMPLDFKAIHDAIQLFHVEQGATAAEDEAGVLYERIMDKIGGLKDPDIVKKVLITTEESRGDTPRLHAILERINSLV